MELKYKRINRSPGDDDGIGSLFTEQSLLETPPAGATPPAQPNQPGSAAAGAGTPAPGGGKEGERQPATPPNPGTPAPGKGSEAALQSISDDDFNRFLNERSGGKLKSLTDFEAFEKRPDLSKYPTLESRFKYLEQGGDDESFNRYLSLKPDELADLDAVRIVKTAELKGMTPDEIDFLLTQQYNLKSEDAEAKKAGEIMLKADAIKARESLLQQKNKLAVPDGAADREAAIEKARTDRATVENFVKTDVAKFQNFQIDMGEGEQPFNFNLSDEDRAFIEKKVLSLSKETATDLGTEPGKDGKEVFSLNTLYKNLFMAKYGYKILSSVVSNAKSRGMLNMRDTLSNVQDFRNTPAGGSIPAAADMEDAFLKSIENDGR